MLNLRSGDSGELTASQNTGRRLLVLSGSLATAAGVYALLRYRRHRLDIEAAYLGAIVGALNGARIIEVGAGKGTMAFRIARRLGPTGLLIATDNDPSRVRALRAKAAKLHPRNVSVLPGTAQGSELPPASCTGIYLRGSYHHITDPAAMNRSLFGALRRGGVLVVIDFRPRWILAPWTPKGIPEDRGGHGIDEDLVIREVKEAGFRFLQQVAGWPGSMYCLLFQKP